MRGATTLRPMLWLNSLWTIPQIDLHSVDPAARWLIMGQAAVLIMSEMARGGDRHFLKLLTERLHN